MSSKPSDKNKNKEKLIDEFADRLARILLAQALIEHAKKNGKPVDPERIINEVLWM